ncbi:MAG: prolipoprotein diacylglyceryl transferase [Bacilli bacterium]|nr:prolipoprotein diacylglyceryl transferase [Bacilli bacterium]
MNSVLLDLGFIQITYYAIIILIAILCSYFVIVMEANKYNYDKEFLGNLLFWTILFGIIGARLYYVLFNLDYYSANPSEIYKIWNGGLAIHGGIIFGMIFAALYSLKYKGNILKLFDIFGVGLIIGQAIGRWGNFFNTEAHGGETTRIVLEKMLIIPKFVIDGMKIDGVYYQPTFYYEFLWCLLGFIILILIRKFYKYLKVGQLASLYFVWYGIGRFFIEGMRTDSLMYGDIRVAQVVSLLSVFIGASIFVYKLFSNRFSNLYVEEYSNEIKF